MKNLGASKDAEPSLRCLLGLPGVQLKAVIAAYDPIREMLAKLLVVLSVDEKEEIISGVGCAKFSRFLPKHIVLFLGRWAGIGEVNATAIGRPDFEKEKILRQLQL